MGANALFNLEFFPVSAWAARRRGGRQFAVTANTVDLDQTHHSALFIIISVAFSSAPFNACVKALPRYLPSPAMVQQ